MTDEELCRFLRHTDVGVGCYEEAAARIEALRAERDAATARAEKAEAALREAVEWADRHGKEPSWLDSARAALAPVEAKGGDDGRS